MARRPMRPGTYGKIRTVKISDKPRVWESRARFRLADGSYARPRRRGSSQEDAEDKLKAFMLELANEVRGGELSKDSRMAHVAKLWLEEIKRSVALGDTAPKTHEMYAGWTNKWIVPKVGQLTAGELERSVMTCEKVILNGPSKSTARGVKAAFGLLCGFAVRHGAMDNNPVRSTAQLSGDRKKVESLTLAQRLDLMAKLETFVAGKVKNKHGRDLGEQARVWRDLPDRFRARFATGVRLGEILAIRGADVDTRARTITIDHHVVYVAGEGTVRMPGRKAGAPPLTLRYPTWSAELWRRLKIASGEGPCFPNSKGQWINPKDAAGHESTALDACGYDWVTGHVIRKTVANVLKDAGLSTPEIADQLGNSAKVLEDHYLQKGVTNDKQAAALESMLGG